MGLIDDVGPGLLGLDTCILIDWIEDHPDWASALRPLVEAIDTGRSRVAISELCLLETLVGPLRAGDAALALRYERILTSSRNLRLVSLDRGVLTTAAQIRAATNARTPDAIHLASALRSGCAVFLTRDRRLPRIPGLRLLDLRDYGPASTAVHDRPPGRYGASTGRQAAARKFRRR